MRQVKITVLKRAFHESLVRDYAKPGLGPCRFKREGIEFISRPPHETLKTFWETACPLL